MKPGGPHPRHTEVPKLGVELQLQLPAYATATATPDHGNARSWQRQILNPLSKARNQIYVLMDLIPSLAQWVKDGTRNLMVPSQIH